MKKQIVSAILFCSALLLALAACSGQGMAPQASISKASAENISALETGVWPENDYTRSVPQPAAGTVAGGWLDAEKSYCYIEFAGMAEEDSQNYMDSLQQAGFAAVETVSEEINGESCISVGTVLTNDTVNLSIAVLQNHFGMYISLAE